MNANKVAGKGKIIMLSLLISLSHVFPNTSSKKFMHYKNLIEEKVPERVASFTLHPKFRLYRFAFKRKSSSRFTYEDYRRLIDPAKRAEIAVEFLLKNYGLLKNVERVYNIKPLHIAALVAVETSGGSYLGSYSMFNALYSQYFYYMSKYKETNSFSSLYWKRFYLEQIVYVDFLIDHGYDVFSVSSRAGAIGIGQFMPYSIYKYGIDADKDGKIDMFGLKDAIFSIANYLYKHGGDKDIEKAYYYYNGHIWYQWVLKEVISIANEIIEKRYKYELERLEKNYLSPFETVELESSLLLFYREINGNFEVSFIGLLDLLKKLTINQIFLYPSKERIKVLIPKEESKSF